MTCLSVQPTMPMSPGTSLGHYDVTALLCEGGMGQVWQAADTQLNTPARLNLTGSPGSRGRPRSSPASTTRTSAPSAASRTPSPRRGRGRAQARRSRHWCCRLTNLALPARRRRMGGGLPTPLTYWRGHAKLYRVGRRSVPDGSKRRVRRGDWTHHRPQLVRGPQALGPRELMPLTPGTTLGPYEIVFAIGAEGTAR